MLGLDVESLWGTAAVRSPTHAGTQSRISPRSAPDIETCIDSPAKAEDSSSLRQSNESD